MFWLSEKWDVENRSLPKQNTPGKYKISIVMEEEAHGKAHFYFDYSKRIMRKSGLQLTNQSTFQGNVKQ